MFFAKLTAACSGLLFAAFFFGGFGNELFSSMPDERASSIPARFVSVNIASGPLWVAREEVSVSQWLECVQDGACQPISLDKEKPDHPATGLNWQDTANFVAWYRETFDKPVRLPTRDEWLEFAADDVPKPRKKLFDDPRMAWAADYDLTVVPQSSVTEPAGSFGSNEHEINDLKGNVWEWTETCEIEIEPSMKEKYGCISGRYAMGQHTAVLTDLLRVPGNAGCSGGQPPANIGLRLVWHE